MSTEVELYRGGNIEKEPHAPVERSAPPTPRDEVLEYAAWLHQRRMQDARAEGAGPVALAEIQLDHARVVEAIMSRGENDPTFLAIT